MNSYYAVPATSDEIYHHGIIGQKWGVRRYQNADGTYTDAGLKRRYGSSGEKKSNKIDELEKYAESEYSRAHKVEEKLNKGFPLKTKKRKQELNDELLEALRNADNAKFEAKKLKDPELSKRINQLEKRREDLTNKWAKAENEGADRVVLQNLSKKITDIEDKLMKEYSAD